MRRAFPNKLDSIVEKYNVLTDKRMQAMALHQELFRSMLQDLLDKEEIKQDTIVYNYKCTMCLNDLDFTVNDYLVATSTWCLTQLTRAPSTIQDGIRKYQKITNCSMHVRRKNGYMATT